MIFEWDDAKNRLNREKHGLGFEAAREFKWETAVIREDKRHDYGEVRWRAFGFIGNRLHSLVFTRRGQSIRIINLRKSNENERKLYEKDAQK